VVSGFERASFSKMVKLTALEMVSYHGWAQRGTSFATNDEGAWP
jgi:hypothetical protein